MSDDQFSHQQLIDDIVSRLDSEKKIERRTAAYVLDCLAIETPGLETRRQKLLQTGPAPVNPANAFCLLGHYASRGRHLPEVRQRLIHLASDRSADVPRAAAFALPPADQIMVERGCALDTLRLFHDHADECLPVLIEAVNSFEEYDPDWCYNGPLGRISAALAAFGENAGPAAATLAVHLNDEEDAFPQAILEALQAIGPAAYEALPMLHAFREKRWSMDVDEPMPDLNAGITDEYDDPVGFTIQCIMAMREN